MKRFWRLAALVTALACALAPAVRAETAARADVRALFVNVGKGDAALLLLGEGRYLVDTGKSDGYDRLAAALSAYGVTRLDGVILSHTDKDHVGGLKKLLKSDVEVAMLYAGALHSEASDEDHPVYKAAQKYGVPMEWLAAGDALPLGEGCEARVLGPLSEDPLNENNNSLVLDVATPEGNLLFTGDMELDEEGELLAGGLIPRATVLKVAHHGEGDATSLAFAQAVAAQWAVISTDSEEEPDTPDDDVLTRLWSAHTSVALTQDADIGVMVTLRDGAATAESVGPAQ